MSTPALPLSAPMIALLRTLTRGHGLQKDDLQGREHVSMHALVAREFAAEVPGGYQITRAGVMALEAHDRIFGAAHA